MRPPAESALAITIEGNRSKNPWHAAIEVPSDQRWSNALNWSDNQVPEDGDDVTIDVLGDVTIEYDAGDVTLYRLSPKDHLRVTAGSLNVTSSSTASPGHSVTAAGATTVMTAKIFTATMNTTMMPRTSRWERSSPRRQLPRMESRDS